MGSNQQFDPRIDQDRLPGHIAIIMDGNGRWAKARGKTRVQGHEAGSRAVRTAVEACRELGVRALSLYAFSTENWRRSKLEVDALFRLLRIYIRRELDEIHSNNIRVRFIGRVEGLPAKAQADARAAEERTSGNTGLQLCIALNYGGRAEMVDAARRLARDAAEGRIVPEDIQEEDVAKRLYVPELSEVDLLIRTSGELRVSNFLLWQISYAEIVAPETFWPDFSKQDLYDAIVTYQQRDRRFGGRP